MQPEPSGGSQFTFSPPEPVLPAEAQAPAPDPAADAQVQAPPFPPYWPPLLQYPVYYSLNYRPHYVSGDAPAPFPERPPSANQRGLTPQERLRRRELLRRWLFGLDYWLIVYQRWWDHEYFTRAPSPPSPPPSTPSPPRDPSPPPSPPPSPRQEDIPAWVPIRHLVLPPLHIPLASIILCFFCPDETDVIGRFFPPTWQFPFYHWDYQGWSLVQLWDGSFLVAYAVRSGGQTVEPLWAPDTPLELVEDFWVESHAGPLRDLLDIGPNAEVFDSQPVFILPHQRLAQHWPQRRQHELPVEVLLRRLPAPTSREIYAARSEVYHEYLPCYGVYEVSQWLVERGEQQAIIDWHNRNDRPGLWHERSVRHSSDDEQHSDAAPPLHPSPVPSSGPSGALQLPSTQDAPGGAGAGQQQPRPPSPSAAVSATTAPDSTQVPGYDGLLAFMPHGPVDPDPKGGVTRSPHGWLVGNPEGMTPAQRQRLLDGLEQRRGSCFAGNLSELRGYNGLDGALRIPLRHSDPIFQTARRYTPAEEAIRDAKCVELRDAGLIVRAPITCQWASRPTMPAKKDPDGNWTDHRFCVDYRRVNDATIPDRYGLHLADEVLQQVARHAYWSKLDARQAFLQVPIVEEDQPKTAFWWRNELWMFTHMPYGLVSGSAKCQRIMDVELAAAGLADVAKAFVDDVSLSSTDGGIDGHIDVIFAVLDALAAVNILCHPAKCCFLMPELELLGHAITPNGVAPHESKVAAIRALTSPTTIKELRSKIAYLSYYRCYIPHFSTIAAPLNELLRKDVPWQWGSAQEQAFQQLKDIVCTPGVVLRPFDPLRDTKLYTDWSKVGIAAVLHQVDVDGNEYLVSCLSRSLNPHERNASSYEGEALAAVWGVRSHRQHLHGVPFTLVTDHQPLKWLMSNQELTGKHMRWALVLQEFTFVVVHRPGAAHTNVDVLSRYPLPGTFDPTGACLDPVGPPLGAALTAVLACFMSAQSITADIEACYYGGISSFAPTADELLHLPPACAGEQCPGVAAREAAGLAAAASRWVSAAWDQLSRGWSGQRLALGDPEAADQCGVRPTVQLSTYPVGAELLAAAQCEGIVLYEPFGGLCAGLDMVLTCGLRVKQYYYSDTDDAAVAVARERVAQFHAQYPHLFDLGASERAFSALPMDVREVDSISLVGAGALEGRQWLVVAGWSCEDLSPAGKGEGLEGSRSSNFFDAVRIVGTLQQLQANRPPAFIMENTAMQASFGHPVVRDRDFPRICNILGEPVLLDAAQVGSYAHRLRNYWSNVMPADQVSRVLAQASRLPGRFVDAVLDQGRRTRPVQRVQGGEFYQCNELGQPPCALPTLVAFPSSRAFRGEQPGMLLVEGTGALAEPNPDERERILGYPTGCTRAPGVSERQRHTITGRAMDRHAMVHLLAVMLELAVYHRELVPAPFGHQHRSPPELGWPYSPEAVGIMQSWGWDWGLPLQSPSALDPIVEPVCIVGNEGTRGLGYQGRWEPGHGGTGLGGGLQGQATAAVAQLSEHFSALGLSGGGVAGSGEGCGEGAVYGDAELYLHYCGLSALAERQDVSEKAASDRADPHLDAGLMFFLQHGKLPQGAVQKEAARIRRRAGRYVLVDGRLQRTMSDGSKRLVPSADRRLDIVRQTHESTGHFGVKRTKNMLMASFWWPSMEADVVKVLATCEPCARIKASFNAERPELQPLPIEGLFYRWGVDMAGPFAASADGNLYVLIMIEHFSKQIELVAVKEKSAKCNAYAFLSTVLARYGACAEVLTDRGAEFQGEFHQLLVECLIDHRTTSPNHPQSDGLAERAVQTLKKALGKYVVQHRNLGDWDWKAHWVALGYRASRQAATGLSPYELLFGTKPTIPPAIRERVENPVLDFADPEQAAEHVLQRAQLLEKHCAIAMSNLRIAQHRDTLRYQTVRSGAYMPVTVKFEPGDFVYVRRRTVVNSLQSEARPGVFRVLALLPSGVVVLQGRCGRTMKVNVAECAPCHLTNINPALDPALQRVQEDFPCAVCGSPDDEEVMLLCDGCFKGFHIYCLQPPLAAVPEEDIWLCSDCKLQGMDEQVVAVLRQQNMPVAESDAPLFPNVQQRAHDAAAQQLHGHSAWLPGTRADQPWVEGLLEYVPRMERRGHSRSPLRWVAAGKQPVYLSLRKADRLVKAGRPESEGEGAAVMLSSALQCAFVAESQGAAKATALSKLLALEDQQHVTLALQEWCGAAVDVGQAEACLAAIREWADEPRGGELGFSAGQVWALVQAVDLRVCDKVAVAGGVSEVLKAVLKERYGKALWELDKQPGQALDQVSPRWYKKAHVRKPLDWVFLCPRRGLVSLALGLAVQQARKGVALLLPRSALTNTSSLLRGMLLRYEQQQRLVCLSSDSDEQAWVVVFENPQLERLMVSLRGKVHSTGWVLAGLSQE